MVILNEEVFDKTQGYVNKRIPHDSYSGVKVKDSFLLSDLIYCGYCGKKLKAENNKNRPKKGKTSEIRIYRRYVCEHAKNNHVKHEQRDFGADKHELIIISSIIEMIKKIPFLIDNEGIKQEKELCRRKIEKIKEELNYLYSFYYQLDKENKTTEKSTLEKEFLVLNKMLFTEESCLVELKSKEKSIELLIKELPEWERRYNESSLTEKSQMLARLVEKVILKKGNFEVVTKDYVLQPDVISQKVN